MIELLLLMLKPMLWFQYNPKKYFYLFPFALIGLFVDVLMNNTIVPMIIGGGWFEEWTFSTRLERLCVVDTDEFLSKDLCISIAKAINRVCPTHDHIKAVMYA